MLRKAGTVPMSSARMSSARMRASQNAAWDATSTDEVPDRRMGGPNRPSTKYELAQYELNTTP